jgi:hexosaminidase
MNCLLLLQRKYQTMKISTFISIILLSATFNGCQQDIKTTDLSCLSIIPKPVEIKTGEGVFRFSAINLICYDQDQADIKQVANYLTERIESSFSNLKLQVENESDKSGIHLHLNTQRDSSLGDEGYLLVVNDRNISVSANKPSGLFYGIQTLFQLMPSEIYGNKKIDLFPEIGALEIKDKPRYPYRGMHLDPCRHFFSVEFTKNYIDYLAFHKMNVFHWHLTEDQGWRIEIKKYPKLTSIGSKRKQTINSPQYYDESKNSYDGIPHEGYYTQEEVTEIVAYAAERFIEVIPEIEMPGHSRAALAAYPELGCTGGPYEVLCKWGVKEDVYCAGDDNTFQFLEDVIDEVITLFPSQYIHIGGDECPKDRWEACDKCRQRIQDHELNDAFELQSYFVARMERYINSKGKTLIGWSEIMEGGIAPNAILESWLGVSAGVEAAKQKHKVIMSPYSHLYFDGIQVEPKRKDMEPWGQRYCWTTTERVYSFEPTPDTIRAEYHPYFIGAEGTMWTEYIAADEHLEYMLFPRLAALSEVCWTVKSGKDYQDFKYRLEQQFLRYQAMDVNYRIPHPEGLSDTLFIAAGDSIAIIKPSITTEIRYTLDGSEPELSSDKYVGAIPIEKNTTIKARCFIENGRGSSTFTSTILLKTKKATI